MSWYRRTSVLVLLLHKITNNNNLRPRLRYTSRSSCFQQNKSRFLVHDLSQITNDTSESDRRLQIASRMEIPIKPSVIAGLAISSRVGDSCQKQSATGHVEVVCSWTIDVSPLFFHCYYTTPETPAATLRSGKHSERRNGIYRKVKILANVQQQFFRCTNRNRLFGIAVFEKYLIHQRHELREWKRIKFCSSHMEF